MVLRKAVAETWEHFTRAADGVELAAAAAAAAATGGKPSTSTTEMRVPEAPVKHESAVTPAVDSAGVAKVPKPTTASQAPHQDPESKHRPSTTSSNACSVGQALGNATAASGLTDVGADGVTAEADDGRFFAAPKFEGSRQGFVFKAGSRGLGYYLDEPPQPAAACIDSASEAEAAASEPAGTSSAGLAPATAAAPAADADVLIPTKDAIPGLTFTNTLMFQLD
jgi:hypothetical protein